MLSNRPCQSTEGKWPDEVDVCYSLKSFNLSGHIPFPFVCLQSLCGAHLCCGQGLCGHVYNPGFLPIFLYINVHIIHVQPIYCGISTVRSVKCKSRLNVIEVTTVCWN